MVPDNIAPCCSHRAWPTGGAADGAEDADGDADGLAGGDADWDCCVMYATTMMWWTVVTVSVAAGASARASDSPAAAVVPSCRDRIAHLPPNGRLATWHSVLAAAAAGMRHAWSPHQRRR